MKILLIDANALIYRIYHALPLLKDHLGRPVNVLYGLSNILLKLLNENRFDYIFALYDRPEPTIRHKIYEEYKATRPPIKEDLKIQIPLSKKIFFAFDIPVIEKIGYEADDLIATLKEKLKEKGEIIILTGDLDTLQLVDNNTKILTMKKGITEMVVYDEKEVEKKFGIKPFVLPDYKALVGDTSDNIIGIKGIGPKTASSLLDKFGNLENLIQACKEGRLDLETRKKILENEEKLLFNKNLVTLKKDVDLEIDIKPYQGYNLNKLIETFQEFGFKSIIQRISKEKLKNIFETKEVNKTIFQAQINSPFQIKEDFFFILEKDKIKIIDKEGIKIIDKNFLKDILTLPQNKYTYGFKNIIKEILNNDFYFDKKVELKNIFDIKIIFWLLNPNKTNPSLENIILFENPQLIKFNFDETVLKTSQKLLEKLKENELLNLYLEIEFSVLFVLARMELRGIKVDLEKLNEFRKFLNIQKEKIIKEIWEISGIKFNPLSTKELRNVLFEKLKIKSKGLKKTPKGEISTQEEELLKIINEHPVIKLILDYRKINKFLSGYTENFLKNYSNETKRLHTNFEETGSVTGRIFSEKPNLQNIPLEGELADFLREVFVSENGFLLISGDYSQIELRILAHLSKDEVLINSFKEGLDIHSQTAKFVFGSDSPENRRKAKIINYGIVYGISAKGLAGRLNIPVSEAQKLINRFFYFYQGVKKYRDEIIDFARTYSYVETLFKRKRFIPEINSGSYREKTEAERIAINMPIQGFAADLIKKALIEIDDCIYKRFKDKAFILLQIHDEVICEVKEEIKEEFKDIIKEIMENIYPLNVELKVNIKEGKSLKEIEK